jgi:POT family proton-dependent oligopeptide transporter
MVTPRWRFTCCGPPAVIPIIGNELCERWCFYSVRAVLVLFLKDRLEISPDDAISWYSFFMAACYFAPLLGGYVSDVYLGRYRTILAFNVFYLFGLAVLGGTAFVDSRAGAFIGLALMALGTGGIKPCVSAFGADQLVGASQRDSTAFFLLFYASINAGSTLSYIVTPIIRAVYGFQWAFLLSLLVLALSLLVFIAGSRLYRVLAPARTSVYSKFVAVFCAASRAGSGAGVAGVASDAQALELARGGGCGVHAAEGLETMPLVLRRDGHVSTATAVGVQLETLERAGVAGNMPSTEDAPAAVLPPGVESPAAPVRLTTGWRWLDKAFGRAAPTDVLGVAAVLRILPLFLCLPVFWALFDSQGSVWTLQREHLRTLCLGGGDVACLTTEQLGVANPLFVIVLVPLVSWVIGGVTRLAHSRPGSAWLEPTPLRRMSIGMYLAAASFVLTGLLQQAIDGNPPGTVSVLWQLPQFFVVTLAEVLVSATGLEWAYTQSPASMRSSVVALFLCMTAIGNLVTGVLYAGLSSTLSSAQIIWLLTGLMLAAAIVFTVLAVRYRAVDAGEPAQPEASSTGVGTGVEAAATVALLRDRGASDGADKDANGAASHATAEGVSEQAVVLPPAAAASTGAHAVFAGASLRAQ